MLQLPDTNAPQKFRCRCIVEMSQTTTYATLQLRRIGALGKHCGIVITLEHQRFAASQHFHNVLRGDSDIGQYPKASHPIGKHKLHWFARIVRHRKRCNLDIAYGKGRMAIDEMDRVHCATSQARGKSTVGQIHRHSKAPIARRSPTDMIAVLMSKHNRIYIRRLQIEACQSSGQLSWAEAAIKQYAGGAHLHHQRITTAAAPKSGEPDHFNWASSSVRILRAVSDVSLPPSRVSTCKVDLSPPALT